MQKARKARSPAPARSTEAPIAMARIALRIVPADESESDHGTAASGVAASVATSTMAMAASKSSAPRECGHASFGIEAPSTSRKPPQPTKAAA